MTIRNLMPGESPLIGMADTLDDIADTMATIAQELVRIRTLLDTNNHYYQETLITDV